MNKLEDYRLRILELVKNNEENSLIKEITEVAMDLKYEDGKNEIIYDIFSEVYDEIFYDIVFKKIQLSFNTKKLLETLALPVNTRNVLTKEKLLSKKMRLWKL